MPSPQFAHLPLERQQQIIHAGLVEFAERGYELASTNRIAQGAGISKGALFKYFYDKETLFLHVCDVCLQEYAATIPQGPVDDLFSFFRSRTLFKMRFMRERPLTYQLLARIAKEPAHPVYAKAMGAQLVLGQQYMAGLQEALPSGVLRDGVTWRHVLDLVTWIVLGLQEQFKDSLPDTVGDDFELSYQSMMDELDVFLDILKSGIYRKEENP